MDGWQFSAALQSLALRSAIVPLAEAAQPAGEDAGLWVSFDNFRLRLLPQWFGFADDPAPPLDWVGFDPDSPIVAEPVPDIEAAPAAVLADAADLAVAAPGAGEAGAAAAEPLEARVAVDGIASEPSAADADKAEAVVLEAAASEAAAGETIAAEVIAADRTEAAVTPSVVETAAADSAAPAAPATPETVVAAVPTDIAAAGRERRRMRVVLGRGAKAAGLAAVILVGFATLRLDETPTRKAPAALPPPAAEPPSAAASDPIERAAYYLARARAGDAEAQYRLAMIYAKGLGRQDLARAVPWFTKAATAGIADAEYNLATLYERGLGVPADMKKALQWYGAAAAQNHPFAEHNLAVAYAQGRGTPQNFSLAAALFRRAAEQGIVPAMVNLAILYQQGRGLAQSAVDSYGWYLAAARRGDAEAGKKATELLAQMPPADRQLAEASAETVAADIRGGNPAVPPPASEEAVASRLEGSTILESGLSTPASQDLGLVPAETAAMVDVDPVAPPPSRPVRGRSSRPAPIRMEQSEVTW